MMFSIIDDMDKRERDYSIDFVKGVAILFVILLHNMPNESIYSIAYILGRLFLYFYWCHLI